MWGQPLHLLKLDFTTHKLETSLARNKNASYFELLKDEKISWRKLLLLTAAGTHSQFFTGVPLPQNTLL